MHAITLITDFGHGDWFVGSMKGVIHRISPGVPIIDITHSIARHDVFAAGFALYASYRSFPEGTVHLVIVDPGVGSTRRALAVTTSRYHFVAPDNGVLSLVLKDDSAKTVVEITNKKYLPLSVSATFHGRDVFAPVGAYLAKGVPADGFGPVINDPVSLEIPAPEMRGPREIIAHVLYIDTFGNLVLDLTGSFLAQAMGVTAPHGGIELRVKDWVVSGISACYDTVRAGEPVAVIGSTGAVEIAVNQGSARALLGVERGDEINIRILDPR